MKILYVASNARHIRDFHIPVINGLLNCGHELTVGCSGAGSLEEPIDKTGIGARIATVDIPFVKNYFSPRNLKAWRRVYRLLKSEDFDLVSTHTALAGFVVRSAALVAKRIGHWRGSCMHTVHGYLFGKNAPLTGRLTYPFERLCAGVTDALVVMNKEDMEHAAKLAGRNGAIYYIPGMGVDTVHFRPPESGEKDAAREALREELGLSEGFMIFCAAEFSARKNHRDLIRAMPYMPSVNLLLAGDGGLIGKTKSLASRLGVGGRVRFLGYVDDTAPYLLACDAVVSAARSEGLPFGVMEAMAAGVPVAASRIKGHVDLLPESVLFSPGKPREIAERVTAVLEGGMRGKDGTRESTQCSVLPPEFAKDSALKAIMEIYECFYLY